MAVKLTALSLGSAQCNAPLGTSPLGISAPLTSTPLRLSQCSAIHRSAHFDTAQCSAVGRFSTAKPGLTQVSQSTHGILRKLLHDLNLEKCSRYLPGAAISPRMGLCPSCWIFSTNMPALPGLKNDELRFHFHGILGNLG